MRPLSLVILLALAGCGHASTAASDDPVITLGGEDRDTHPKSPAVARAEELIAHENPADAVPLLEDAVREDPRDARAFFTLGLARTLLGDAAGAEAALRAALAIDATYPEAWNELGLLFRDTDRLADALAALGSAVESRGDFHDAWYNLALAREDAGELQAARAAYDHALEGLGDDPIVRFHRAGLLLRIGDAPGAKAELLRARTLASGRADVLRAIGRTFTRMGEHDEAATTLASAVDATPQPSVDVLIEAAGAARSARRVDASVELARRAATMHPMSARAFAMLALVETDAGRRPEARAAVERAARLDTEGALTEDLARLRAAIEASP